MNPVASSLLTAFVAFAAVWAFLAMSDVETIGRNPTGFSVGTCPTSACGGKCGNYASYTSYMFHTQGTIAFGVNAGKAYNLCGCSYGSYTKCAYGCDATTGKCKSSSSTSTTVKTTTTISTCQSSACGGKCGNYASNTNVMFHTQGTIASGVNAGKAYNLCGCSYASYTKCTCGCNSATGQCNSCSSTTYTTTTHQVPPTYVTTTVSSCPSSACGGSCGNYVSYPSYMFHTPGTIASGSNSGKNYSLCGCPYGSYTKCAYGCDATTGKCKSASATTTTFNTTTTVIVITTTTVPGEISSSSRYYGKELLVIVDKETYLATTQELEIYKNDVKRDIGANVVIYANDWTSVMQVRDVIKAHYQQGSFLGAVLVGNIPYAIIEYYNHNNNVLTDWIYQDLDADFSDTDSDGKYDYKLTTGSRETFTARIKPTLSGAEGISQVKSYFIKNHQYRISNQYSGMLVYSGIDLNERNKTETAYMSSYSGAADYIGFPDSTTVLYSSSITEQKSRLLQELKNHYRFTFVNVHGSYFAMWLGGNTYINATEIRNSGSNSMFVILASCSNGNFGYMQDYMAGDFLFYGNTLAVSANSAVTMMISSGDLQTFNIFTPLAAGAILGEYSLNDGSHLVSHLFGDPTIQLIRNPSSYPAMSINPYPPDAGNVKRGQTSYYYVNITNTGNKRLTMRFNGAYGAISYQSVWPDGTVQNSGSLWLEPGQKGKLKFKISSSADSSLGSISGTAMFVTNDPKNPYLHLTCTANIVE